MTLRISNIQTIGGHRIDYTIPSKEDLVLEAQHLTLFPALIDPHVHFRTPGAEHKESWTSGARAALFGGVTTVLDMPNNTPSCCTQERFLEKRALVEQQLRDAHIPLNAYFYLGVDQRHLSEICPKEWSPSQNNTNNIAKEEQREGNCPGIIGLKVYMGSSTGDLLMDDPSALKEVFQLAHRNNLLVAVHAEDEALIRTFRAEFSERTDPATHSLVRNATVAKKAVEHALTLTEECKTRLYITHVSTKDELDLIRAAKKRNLPVYAEATPHHLFLHDSSYQELGTKALVNPPLRSKQDQNALWEALYDGTIDTIGTDHAPHTLEEKRLPYGKAPSGFPSIEFYFALLLDAHARKILSLERIVSLTHTRPQEIFSLPPNDDVVLVDLSCSKTISPSMIRSRAGWTPYLGKTLTGWPRYTICHNILFDLEQL